MYELYTNIRCWFHAQKINLFEKDPNMEGIVLKARLYSFRESALTRHTYDGKHYEFHTYMVYKYALKYIHLIPEKDRADVLAACFTHDLIEDCRQTFNDVRKATNKKVALLTSALTTIVHGHTRRDRAPRSYYKRIKKEEYADFIKICDRLANVSNSASKGHTMLLAYRNEMAKFKSHLFREDYAVMFDELDGFVNINK